MARKTGPRASGPHSAENANQEVRGPNTARTTGPRASGPHSAENANQEVRDPNTARKTGPRASGPHSAEAENANQEVRGPNTARKTGPRASGPHSAENANREVRSPQEGLVAVGVFGAPHGVRGEMRLKSFTGDPLAIIDYAPLTDRSGQRRFILKKARPFKDDLLIVSVEGVADRDAAAKFTNLEVYASRDLMPPAEDDEFYHADLIGLQAKDTAGKVIGFVIAMHNFGAGDIIEIKPVEGGQTLLLPFTKEIAPQIDLADETITIIMPDEIEGEEEPKA